MAILASTRTSKAELLTGLVFVVLLALELHLTEESGDKPAVGFAH